MGINLFSPGLKVDAHEPADMQRWLDLPVLGSEVMDLNLLGYADYLWYDAHDMLRHFERKTWIDLVRDWDGVEYQLRQEHQAHPEARLGLIYEGVAEPMPNGVMVYTRSPGRNVMTGRVEGKQAGLFKKIINGMYGMSDFLEVWPSTNMGTTATILSSFYQHDQNPEHSVFHRHLKNITWNPNRHVAALLGLAQNDTNLGVVKCQDLIEEYGTVWNVIHEDPGLVGAIVKGISAESIRNLDRKIGRPDV